MHEQTSELVKRLIIYSKLDSRWCRLNDVATSNHTAGNNLQRQQFNHEPSKKKHCEILVFSKLQQIIL